MLWSIRLPRDVQRDNITADYTDGVLQVALPKSQPKSARKIEIRGHNGTAKTGGHAPEESQAEQRFATSPMHKRVNLCSRLLAPNTEV